MKHGSCRNLWNNWNCRKKSSFFYTKLAAIYFHEIGESRIDYEVIKAIYYLQDTPLSYITTEEIFPHLSHGILVDEGKVWFSIDDDGKTREMISAIKCMPLDGPNYRTRSDPESRFPMVAEVLLQNHNMQVQIRTQFLSSDVTYAAYLVCKPDPSLRMEEYDDYSLSYKLNYSSESYISYRSKMEDNGWWMFELFQTINFKRTVDCNVTVRMLKSRGDPWSLLIEGIKFLPMRKFEDEDEVENSEINNLTTSNIEWDNHLPSDYKHFIYYSDKEMMKKPQRDVIFPTKEEAYSILSRGVLINISYEVNMWFWISKLNGKKCFMLPPASLSYNKKLIKLKRILSKDSRIENGLHLLPSEVVGMRFEVPDGLFSPNTTYGCYLVYKTPEGLFLSNTSVVK